VVKGVNRRIVLARRPVGMVEESCFAPAEAPIPSPGDGEVLVQVEYVSIDPAIRGWLGERGSGYLPGVAIGDPVRSNGVGRVVESNAESLPVGTDVTILSGWQEYAVGGTDWSRPFELVTAIPEGATTLEAVTLLGQAGMTAWAAVTQVLRPTEGQTFVVSAAASAVGSLAGQLAKMAGARVVGIAGGPRKRAWCVETLGFDACIDYKADDVYTALKEHCPQGVDIFFDNVGGELLDTVLRRLAVGGRVLLCGTLATDNATEPYGLRNYDRLMSRRAQMIGFNTMDWWGMFPEATKELLAWVRDGTVHHEVELLDGLERAPEALVRLYRGEHLGKLVVRVSPEAAGT
jgi:NADPH-dependent curcumin reductase CurA